MRKLAALFLLTLFLLPACERSKPEIEIPLPTEPPNPAIMQPTSPPPSA